VLCHNSKVHREAGAFAGEFLQGELAGGLGSGAKGSAGINLISLTKIKSVCFLRTVYDFLAKGEVFCYI